MTTTNVPDEPCVVDSSSPRNILLRWNKYSLLISFNLLTAVVIGLYYARINSDTTINTSFGGHMQMNITNSIGRFLLETTTGISQLLLPDQKSNSLHSRERERKLRENDNHNLQYIFVMGLPKSGSDAIHQYFTCQSIPSTHYCCHNSEQQSTTSDQQQQQQRIHFPCNTDDMTCGQCYHRNLIQYPDRLPFDTCVKNPTNGDVQVISQFDVELGHPYSWFLPQHYTLPILYESYKHRSVWILNYRQSPEIWADNVLHWYSTTQRMLNAYNIPYHTSINQTRVTRHIPLIRRTRKRKRLNVLVDPMVNPRYEVESLQHELEISYQRAHDDHEHERRRNALINIYKQHKDKVKKFALQYHQPYVELNVDNTTQSIESSLGMLISKLSQTSSINRNSWRYQFDQLSFMKKTCWNFNASALDNDWNQFDSLFPPN